ncbi:sensor histidine kinase [Flavobacterium sp. ZT3R18]|uniref:sensor histidine kinase n=1 Tax=Flavobacterium sp. ZT3R18 TaxID=2594429 RepID=UPI00117B9D39|nr:sensor histidine kinase [Flavobacterium sp. ZT3R18]TRX32035.1 sensor histidine kinase [Flavobacterium sp. ZT3R18]
MKKNISFYVMHTCLCFTFLFLPYAFSSTGSIFSLPKLASNPHDRIYFFIYFLLLLFFYFNYYILIPKIYFAKKQIQYVVVLVLFLFFFLWISTVFDTPDRNFLDFGDPNQLAKGNIPPPQYEEFKRPNGPIPPKMPNLELSDLTHFGGPPTQYNHTILVYLIGVISSLFIAIKIRLQKVEEDKMKSELSFLKAQINPHFLFNTLNSIYSLAIKKDDKTADAVVQLSELMRYIITNANDDVIALDKEINYIDNYILLQKTRLGNTVTVDYTMEGDPFGKAITPLILISFIENAFKHGVNPNENSEICIRITIVGDYLTLYVSNNKVQTIKSDSGIGLQNTIERLTLLYPNNHVLYIDDNPKIYQVTLTLKVT